MNQRAFTILLIDDDEDELFLVRERLLQSPNNHYQIEWTSSYEAARTAMADKWFDAVLVDYRIGDHTGIDIIREAAADNYPAPIILLTGRGNYEVALEAMEAGAADYLNKGEINSSLLDRSIRYAIERKQHEAALLKSEQALRESEGRFRVALSNVAIAVFSTDLDLRYTWFYSMAMGITPDQFIGRRDDEILPPEKVQKLLDLKRRVLAERVAVHEEVEVALGNQLRTLIVSIEPYFNQRGEIIGVIGAFYDVTEQRRLERERVEHRTEMAVQHRLTGLREQERQAIAREIHDGPVQNLSGLIFRMQYSYGSIQDPAMKSEIAEIQSKIQETVDDLREMMNELRPPSLIRFGVARAIQNHLDSFREKHPEMEVDDSVHRVDDELHLSDQVKLNVYRIYHEAINNIVQHAQASKIYVGLTRVDHHLLLKVEDNGKGFRESFELIDHTQKNHFGLAGMKERANLIGGELTITTDPGRGTTILVSIPLENIAV